MATALEQALLTRSKKTSLAQKNEPVLSDHKPPSILAVPTKASKIRPAPLPEDQTQFHENNSAEGKSAVAAQPLPKRLKKADVESAVPPPSSANLACLPSAGSAARSRWKAIPATAAMPSYGHKLTPNTNALHPSDLALIGSAPDGLILPLDSIYGLKDAKQALEACIRTPYFNPHLYSINPSCLLDGLSTSGAHNTAGGRLPLSHVIFLYGKRGSGKRTLVRSFAAEHALSLLEADAPGFRPAEELDALYKAAVEMSPAIILLNECEGYFQKGSPFCGLLWGWLEQIKQARLPVWTVFCSNVKIDSLDLSIASLVNSVVWSGTLNAADRERMWLSAVQRLLPESQRQTAVLSKEGLDVLVRASDNCIAKDICGFVQDVFLSRIAELGRDVELMPVNDPRLLPTEVSFRNACFLDSMNKRRITRRDPKEDNVNYYYAAPIATQATQVYDGIVDPYGGFHK